MPSLRRMRKFITSHALLILLIGGLLVRLSLLFVDYSFDVNSHMAWGREALKYGLSGFYERASIERYSTIYPNYPPVPIFYFMASVLMSKLLYTVAWFLNVHIPAFPSQVMAQFDNYHVLAAITKLLAVVADIILAWIVSLYGSRIAGKKGGIIAALLIAWNPVFIYISAVWGQIDSVPLAFLAGSFYLLLYTDLGIVGSILFALALLSKQTSVIFIPLYLLILIKNARPMDAVKNILAAIAVFMLLMLPFYKSGNTILFPFITYANRMIGTSGLPFVSNHAFNFWPLITGWRDIPDTRLLDGASFRVWGYVIVAVVCLPMYLLTLIRKNSAFILYTAVLTAYTAFLFLTKIHERHFLAVLPFLAPFAARNRKFLIAFIVASLIHMANLYHNWSVPRIEPILNALLTPGVTNIFIIASLLVYAYLMISFIRERGRSIAT